MKQKSNVQKWCALFAEIPVPINLMLTILKNDSATAEHIIWEYLHTSWLPPREANLQELRRIMPKIRNVLPVWTLGESILLALCRNKNASEFLKLYIIYNGIIPESIRQELQKHSEKKEIFRLYSKWAQPATPEL